jgi:sugar lactone lactonase YvrE
VCDSLVFFTPQCLSSFGGLIMRRGLFVALAVAFALFAVTSAMALPVTYVTTWTGTGTSPRGIEVDGSGNVYVADIGGTQVLKYNSSGSLQQTIAPSSGDGALNAPVGAAISPVDGSIYVCSAAGEGEYVRKFASDGSYVTRWAQDHNSMAITTDTAGNVYVQAVGGSISKYDSSGNNLGGMSGTGGNGIALNPSETIAYGFDLGNNLYATDLVAGTTTALASLINSSDRGEIAVNRVTGNIYVAERAAKAVQEFTSGGTLIQSWDTWGDAGSQVSYSGTSPSFGEIWGIAVNSATNNIYVADQSGKVMVFNEAVPEPSTVVLLTMGLIGMLAYAWRKRK